MEKDITIQDILYAYQHGYFPMADESTADIYWYNPDPRAIVPFREIKMHRSVRKAIEKENFTFRINTEFEKVIRYCSDRENTWISDKIIELFTQLHFMGYAHCVETWQNNSLVGGLYGLSIGGAFFGESMFSKVSTASKGAFFYLIEHLKIRGFSLLDSQYSYHHTKLLGAIEIPKVIYLRMLDEALVLNCKFQD